MTERFAMEGEAALDLIVAVYLDGYLSGAASALRTFTKASDAAADGAAEALTAALAGDRIAFEEVRHEVMERLTGRDSGPKLYEIRANPGS